MGWNSKTKECKVCHATIASNAKTCPSCGAKNKKPFYKRIWFWVLVVIAFFIIVPAPKDKEPNPNKKFKWEELELHEHLPKPKKLYGEINTNTATLVSIDIADITKQDYKDYVEQCIAAGFVLDLEKEPWDDVYGAFNEEGYSIRIIWRDYSDEMGITLETPEKDQMKTIEWPTTGLAAKVPAPKSDFGRVSWDNSESFIVHMGNMTQDDYNAYVKECEELGFNLEHSRDEKYYNAKNTDGYEITLRYIGANVVEIAVKAPETQASDHEPENDAPEVEVPVETEKPTEEPPSVADGLSAEFKEAMDSYEKFMDEYVAFMKKYNANPSDVGLLEDYIDYLDKYTTFCEEFEKWDDEEMNDAELQYYLEVQSRVIKKLSEVAG